MNRLSRQRSAQIFSRTILPLILFVAVVGGIAWLTQNLPGRPGKPVPPPNPTAAFKPLVKFDNQQSIEGSLYVKAVWDPEDPEYAMEFERDVEGHYDYPFANISDGPLELGLIQSSCDCIKLEACAFSPNEANAEHHWIPLAVNENKGGLPIPAGAHGIVRVGWKSKKQEGQRLNLAIRVWCQPQAVTANRQFIRLETPVITRPPLLFDPETKKLGSVMNQTQTQFIAWSATRAKPALVLNETAADPCFVYDLQPMSAQECRALQESLKESHTKVKSAFRINVTIHEERAGKFLDQGHFEHRVPLKLDGEDITGPALVGTVRSDIEIGSPTEDGGKIQLKSFNARDGIKKVIPIRAKPDAVLQVKSYRPESFQIKLEKSKDTPRGGRALWNLEIVVPPGAASGPLPEDSVLILLHSQNAQSRSIRIPMLGNAFQG